MIDAQAEFMSFCEKMSDEVVKPFTDQKEFIYIDSDLLYNYRLGAVMSQIRGEEDYKYVQEHIQEYLEAPTLECAKFFPKFNLTEEDLDKIIKNPEYFVFMNAAAPTTTFLKDLEMVIRIINSINRSRETKRPLKITINQRKIEIHPYYKSGLKKLIHDIDNTIVVDFVKFPSWFEVPEEFLRKQDYLFVYDMIEFLQQGSVSQKLMGEVPSALTNAAIITLLQSDSLVPTEEGFTNLKAILECMCDKFTFIPKTILVKDENHG